MDGRTEYHKRTSIRTHRLKKTNMEEMFMKGDKLIAIISEAASSEISLQSDIPVKNQRRRVHITLEFPWSADKAVQQFGEISVGY